MKRLLFLIPTLNKGGAERVLSTLANYYVKQGVSIRIALVSDNVVEYSLAPEIEICSIPSPRASVIQRLIFIRQQVKDYKPDAVISFLSVTNMYACLAMFLNKTPLFISERNDPAKRQESKFKSFLINFSYNLATGIVFQTKQAQQFFNKGIQAKSIVIENPVISNLPQPYNGEKKRKIVAVGRLELQKNYPLLLETLATLPKRHQDVILEIYGEGKCEQELKELAQTLGIEQRVRWMGVHDDVHEKIKDAKLFVMTSNYEGMPNALMEAMAIGLPCISTDCPCGGPRKLIHDKKDGILIPVGDDRALLKSMVKILDDETFSARLAENSTYIRQEYSIDKIAKRWRTFIE